MQDETKDRTRGEPTEGDEKFRISTYVTESDLTSLDEIRAHLRRQEKRQVDRSAIIREAIRHYHEALLAR